MIIRVNDKCYNSEYLGSWYVHENKQKGSFNLILIFTTDTIGEITAYECGGSDFFEEVFDYFNECMSNNKSWSSFEPNGKPS